MPVDFQKGGGSKRLRQQLALLAGAMAPSASTKPVDSGGQAGAHLAFIQSFEQGDLGHFLGLVQSRGNSLDAVGP